MELERTCQNVAEKNDSPDSNSIAHFSIKSQAKNVSYEFFKCCNTLTPVNLNHKGNPLDDHRENTLGQIGA